MKFFNVCKRKRTFPYMHVFCNVIKDHRHTLKNVLLFFNYLIYVCSHERDGNNEIKIKLCIPVFLSIILILMTKIGIRFYRNLTDFFQLYRVFSTYIQFAEHHYLHVYNFQFVYIKIY